MTLVRLAQNFLAERGEGLRGAVLHRLVGVDDRLGKSDWFEAGSDFLVQSEGAIAGGVLFGCGLRFDAAAGQFLGANALEDPPGLMELVSSLDYFFDLVTAGEGAAIEENRTIGILLEEPGGGLEHEVHHEVVLPGGVFDVSRGKNRVAYFVLAEDYGVEMRCQGMG